MSSDSPPPSWYDPPSDDHCPECNGCRLDAPDTCDWCAAGYHGTQVVAGCEGGRQEVCLGPHGLCRECAEEIRWSMDERV